MHSFCGMHASTTEKKFKVWGTIIADWESNRMTIPSEGTVHASYVVVPSGKYVVVVVVCGLKSALCYPTGLSVFQLWSPTCCGREL